MADFVTPAVPSFADLQTAATTPPNTLNAPSGGATQPAVPASQPGGGGPPVQRTYLDELERAGRVNAGQFNNDRDLIEALYGTAETLANQVEQYEKTASVKPETPPPQTAPAAPAADLTKMATVFQQQGWLSLQSGQWVASNPMATELAQQLNRSVMEAQARQAELADPAAFIGKYGADVFKQQLDPLQQRVDQLTRQNQELLEQFQASAPRVDKNWVSENKAKLYTTDASGKEVPTPACKAYGEAWEMARRAGLSLDQIHTYALSVATPHLTPETPSVAPPVEPWAQQAFANPRTDPSFNAPGTVLSNSAPVSGPSLPLGNDGYPTFSSLQGMGIQPR